MSPNLLLLCALLALLVGPASATLGLRSRLAEAWVDGFALACIMGVCVTLVLPHVVGELGVMGAALVALGALVPWLGHRFGAGGKATLSLLAITLAIHVVFDGAVLAWGGEHSGHGHGHDHAHAPLSWAVVAHRLPVGFAIVVATRAAGRSTSMAWALALVMAAATAAGFFIAPHVALSLPHGSIEAFEAFIAGVLMHVVFTHHVADHAHEHHEHAHDHDHAHHGHHHDHAHDHDHHHHGHEGHDHAHHDHEHHHHHHDRPANAWSAFGAISGVLGLAGLVWSSHGSLGREIDAFVDTLVALTLESAPALVLGYTLAGVVPFLLTPSRTESLGRGGKLGQALRGVAFGLPLPVCSCGVLPLYESLIRRGAPTAAAMAFFVATPELGLDAVLLSLPLLGSSLTAARVVAAFAVALLVALAIGWRGEVPRAVDTDPVASHDAPLRDRVASGLRFGFVEVFDHTMPWIALGLVIAAMLEPMLSHDLLDSAPAWLHVPVAAIVGVPIYVCASGATPIAALALHKGLSSGAAIAFLIAGPATNVTTFGVLSRLHGRRTAIAFGFCVTCLAAVAGWTVDALGVTATPLLDANLHDAHAPWWAWACAIALLGLVIASLIRQGPRGALRQILEPIHMH
jgi:hypothetical protein